MTSVDSQKLFCALIVSLTAAGLTACSKPAPPEEPVRAVKVLTVGEQSLQSGLEFAGEVRARVESRLGFRVAGKLTQRLVEVGQHVKAGQMLAQLDPQDFRLATDAAQAQVNAAQVNRDLASADFKRYKELKEQNFISGAELERRDATLKAAQAQLEQAQAQLTGQGNQAAYTRLLTDVSGVVTAVDAEVGQVVAAGTPVLRIAQDGARDLVFAVPEDRVARLKLGSAVLVRPWSGASAVQAQVREVSASADPVTRTFVIKAALPVGSALALGSTVTVLPRDLERSAETLIKLPTSAIFESAKASVVWVLDPASMTLRQQPVQIASADANEVVIASGLQAGMQVVSAGVHVLSPGQKVTLYHEKSALPLAAASAPLAK
jgi:RND family efflux transporter MFP subunit